MTDPAMWSRARSVAKCIVSDWMLLDETERTMDRLVAEIEGELDKAFDDGMKAVVGFSQPLIRAATLEEAATAAETRDLGDNSAQDGLAQEIAAAIRALKEQP